MEIVQERLEREFDLSLLATAPTVEYRVRLRDGTEVPVDNPAHLPDPAQIESISEPMVLATIVVPATYVGNMMELSQERRGQFQNMQYEPGDRVVLTYRMPLGEIIHDFYDQLKSRSKGYASLDYELQGFEEANLVKLDVLVAGSPIDALSMIVRSKMAGGWPRSSRRSSHASCSKFPSRPRSEAKSSRAKRCLRSAKTCSPNAMAATSPASASCSRSSGRAKNG
jgi:GTP-binding protein LepA